MLTSLLGPILAGSWTTTTTTTKWRRRQVAGDWNSILVSVVVLHAGDKAAWQVKLAQPAACVMPQATGPIHCLDASIEPVDKTVQPDLKAMLANSCYP
jgi:hypothetical protein